MAEPQRKPVSKHCIREATYLVCSTIWAGVSALSASPTMVKFAGLAAIAWAFAAVFAARAANRKEGNQ